MIPYLRCLVSASSFVNQISKREDAYLVNDRHYIEVHFGPILGKKDWESSLKDLGGCRVVFLVHIEVLLVESLHVLNCHHQIFVKDRSNPP